MRIVRSVVEDNLDTIHGRLPRPLRPWPRHRGLAWFWMRRVGLPAAVVAALALAARRPIATPAPLAGEPAGTAPVASAVPGGEPARWRPSASRSGSSPPGPIHPGVLALTIRRVVVDAGHGGEHLGTSSVRGLQEKDLTLDIAERVRQLVTTRGFEAIMTRTADQTLSLQQRAATANRRRGDIFVSIHLNSLGSSNACGVETYYLGASSGPELDALAAAENQHSGYSLSDMRSLLDKIYMDARRDESKRLANAVQRALVQTLRTRERHLTDRGVKVAPFVVLLATEMPAILAEVSCLSSRDEAERLSAPAYRQTIAGALVSGIQTFANDRQMRAVERTN